jgi:mannonate dehydratase
VYLGEQLATVDERRLTWAAQVGVEAVALHTTGGSEAERAIAGPDGRWDAEQVGALRARIGRFGIRLEVLSLDVEALWWSLLLGRPDRQERLEVARANVRVAGEAGIPCLKYRIQPIGVLRTGWVPGRGGARYHAFDVATWSDASPTEAGAVDPQRVWSAIEEFLEAVVPVAEQSGVRLACHPQDPALPPGGLRGIPHVLGTVAELDRFLAVAPSPVHGLNFCQGTVAEMFADPASEVPDAVRHFGRQGKIFMVHFRNIQGGRGKFVEVYPDNGDVDMLAAMRVYHEVGYRGMFCPDHVPRSDVDPGGERQFAFCLGYTRALIERSEDGGPQAEDGGPQAEDGGPQAEGRTGRSLHG